MLSDEFWFVDVVVVFCQASLYCWRSQKVFVHSGRVQNRWTLFWRIVHICEASKMTLDYSSIFPNFTTGRSCTGRVAKICYYNVNVMLDALCKFSTRWNDIYDPSTRIIKNPLNSTLFWTRQLNSATRLLNLATRPLNLTTRPLNSATRQKCNYDHNGLPYCYQYFLKILLTFKHFFYKI